jgi:hypothetical protein
MYYVLCSPHREPRTTGGVQVFDEHSRGQLFGYIELLRQALNRGGNVPVTLLEDDCEVPEGFDDYVSHYHGFIHRTGAPVLWFSPSYMYTPPTNNRAYPPYFVHRPAARFVFTQAVTYPRLLAEHLLNWLIKLEPRLPSDGDGRKHNGDWLIGRALSQVNRDFLLHWPPVVQHVGTDSVVQPGEQLDARYRTSSYYSSIWAEDICKLRPDPMVVFPPPSLLQPTQGDTDNEQEINGR